MKLDKFILAQNMAFLISIPPESNLAKLLSFCLATQVRENTRGTKILEMTYELMENPSNLPYWTQDVMGHDLDYSTEECFERIKPRADEFAASFYENLFTGHPELKPLFTTTDMAKQQKKLLSALVLVVENLRNPEALGQVLNALGARHIGYGVIPKYYGPVGEALLMSFEQSLQQDWTPEVKQAWLNAYRAITYLMLKGTGKESSPTVVQDEKEATLKKPTELKVELLNESKQFQPQADQQQKPLVSIQWDGESFKQILDKITNTYQQFKPQLSVQPWCKILKQTQDKLIDVFWTQPVWVVATVSPVIMAVVFVLTDENSLFAEVLGGADTIQSCSCPSSIHQGISRSQKTISLPSLEYG